MNFWRGLEAGMCAAGLVLGTLVAFNNGFGYGLPEYPLVYLPFPFLVWFAIRFGPRGAALGSVLIATLVVYSVKGGHGPFMMGSTADSLRLAGIYVAIVAASNLLLAASAGERSRTFREAVNNERRLRLVLADQTDLICRFRAGGRLTFVNPSFSNFYGKSEEELLGSDFFQKLQPDQAAVLAEKLRTLTDDQPFWSCDHRAFAADGHAEWQQCSIRRLAGHRGGEVEYQVVMQNISARKRAELALQEAKSKLEKLNFQLQMSANESSAAAAEANRANQAKSEFLANMSHEIRTPLNGILGMIELLGQTRLDVRQRDFIAAATESGKALVSVINDVLDFSKIEAGKMTFTHEEFSIRNIIDAVLENASTREPDKNINLAAIVSRNVPHQLVGDPGRLRQVLLNLVGNGIKFTDRGEVVVRVHPFNRSDGRVKLRFEVTDTGVGLSEDQARNLFQPFVQADTSSSRKYGGTGLGLAISRKIVELMDGRIGVTSAAGQGSTFWFEVPFGVPPQPASEHSFPGLVFTQVLVAAPNASLRESLTERLHGWGVVSREIATPDELARVLRHDVQAAVMPLVLCDDEMLAQGGAELRRQLNEKPGKVQCLLLAGPTTTLDGQEDSMALFNTILLKPVRQQSLFDALVAVVAGSKADPLRPARQPGDTEQIRRESPPRRRTAISGLRVLAAEDHPLNRKLCQLMFDSFGVQPEWAVNGREAVEKFKPGRYDVILMDCNMPELDGHEAAAAIRRIEAGHQPAQRIRIIALTANALVGEREKCLAAGMDDYLTKPFTSQQLFQSLLSAAPPPAADGEGGKFDSARLEQLVQEIGVDAVVEMTGDFLNELPDRLTEICRLHAAARWPELKRAAHSLKGLFLFFGFPALADRFQAAEEAAIVADASQVAAQLQELDSQTVAATGELHLWMETRKAAASN
jgi:PAS domain S-box-containing protein